MAIVSRATLNGYFNTGDMPDQSNFVDLIDTLCKLDVPYNNNIMFGDGAVAYAANSVVIGNYMTKAYTDGVAIGDLVNLLPGSYNATIIGLSSNTAQLYNATLGIANGSLLGSVDIGYNHYQPGTLSVNIGVTADIYSSNTINIGSGAKSKAYDVAIGRGASIPQSDHAVAIGHGASENGYADNLVAIGALTSGPASSVSIGRQVSSPYTGYVTIGFYGVGTLSSNLNISVGSYAADYYLMVTLPSGNFKMPLYKI